jgi:hypothetical protein
MASSPSVKGDPNLSDKEASSQPNDVDFDGSPGTPPVVDPAVEKRLLRKLDLRIIPCICWIYLMNFMDRGNAFRDLCFENIC